MLRTKKILRPWWDLYEVTQIPFTIFYKATDDCDNSIFGHSNFSGKNRKTKYTSFYQTQYDITLMGNYWLALSLTSTSQVFEIMVFMQ